MYPVRILIDIHDADNNCIGSLPDLRGLDADLLRFEITEDVHCNMYLQLISDTSAFLLEKGADIGYIHLSQVLPDGQIVLLGDTPIEVTVK